MYKYDSPSDQHCIFLSFQALCHQFAWEPVKKRKENKDVEMIQWKYDVQIVNVADKIKNTPYSCKNVSRHLQNQNGYKCNLYLVLCMFAATTL